MIHLHRPPKPKELTEKEEELTLIFLNEKKDVWNKTYIKIKLLEMSYSKCCYCETKLTEESKYMTVDHYHHKEEYPHEVVEWNNLLPACSRCNSNKGNHNTYKEPIINPVNQNPTDYFYISNYRYRSKDKIINSIARMTIDVLGLNDSKKIVEVRFKIGEELCEKIAEFYNKAIKYVNNNIDNIPLRNRIVTGVKNILRQAQPDAEYSGTMATVIINDAEYIQLKIILENLNLWDDELNQLHKVAESIKYDIKQ